MALLLRLLINQSKDKFIRLLSSLPSSSNKLNSAVGFNDYEKEYLNFKLEVPEYFNFSEHVLEEWKSKEMVSSSYSLFCLKTCLIIILFFDCIFYEVLNY